jgi:alpha-L-fucosidase
MKEIGSWLEVNGEAIYGTRPIAPYKYGNVVFTRRGKSAYAIYLTSTESEAMPRQIAFAGLAPAPGSTVQLLGSRKNLSWHTDAAGLTTVIIPPSLAKSPPCRHAFALRFSPLLLKP